MNASNKWARRLSWDDLDPQWIHNLVQLAKHEDCGGGGLDQLPENGIDVTSALLPSDHYGCANLVARKSMVLAGLPIIPMILAAYHNSLSWKSAIHDGQHVEPGDIIGTISGPAVALLEAERVLLNFIQRLSGIATETARYVAALGDSPTRLLDTRKTTPGFRTLEKYAVARGGGWNHRIGLFDRVMLKDNHLAASGAIHGTSLTDLVRRAKIRWPDLGIEVEVDHIEQIPPIIEAGADILLLDNFNNEQLAQAVQLINSRVVTEASGGITLERIPEMTDIGLDFISTGATVHHSTWTDIGLDWI